MRSAVIVMALLASAPAFGHARLESATPASGASVKSPKTITLKFVEALEPAFSGAVLTGADGKVIAVPSAVSGTAITLLPFSLRPGSYTVTWHSVGHDTHRVTGHFSFKVIP
jgi:methionine-rich copper-binding protein CopC